MTNLPEKTPLVLKHLIETALSEEVKRVESTQGGVLVHCDDAQTQTRVLSLTGYSLEGRVVRCTKVELELTADQVTEFISQRLGTDQKLLTMRQTWQSTP